MTKLRIAIITAAVALPLGAFAGEPPLKPVVGELAPPPSRVSAKAVPAIAAARTTAATMIRRRCVGVSARRGGMISAS